MSTDWKCCQREITPWHCPPIVASISVLRQTISEPTESERTMRLLAFLCALWLNPCVLLISPFVSGIQGSQARKKNSLTLHRTQRHTNFVQIYSIYTPPGCRETTQKTLSSLFLNATPPHRLCSIQHLFVSQRTFRHSCCLGSRRAPPKKLR